MLAGKNALTWLVDSLVGVYGLAHQGSVEKLSNFLKPINIDINAKDDNGLTPLMYALKSAYLTKDLISCGATCDSFDLVEYCMNSNINRLIVLLEKGAPVETDDGQKDIIKCIYERVFDNPFSSLMSSTRTFITLADILTIYEICIKRGISSRRIHHDSTYAEMFPKLLSRLGYLSKISMDDYQQVVIIDLVNTLKTRVCKDIAASIINWIY